MSRVTTIVMIAIAGLVFLIALWAAVWRLPGGHTSSCNLAGRVVQVTSSKWPVNLTSANKTATARVGGRTIVIAPGLVSVDPTSGIRISPHARQVDVSVAPGEIRVVADGIWRGTIIR